MTITFTHIIGQICVNSWILITFLVFFNIFLSRGAKIVLLGIKIILCFALERFRDHFYTRDPPPGGWQKWSRICSSAKHSWDIAELSSETLTANYDFTWPPRRVETSGESPHRPEAVHCLQGLKEGLFQAIIASYWTFISHWHDYIEMIRSSYQ